MEFFLSMFKMRKIRSSRLELESIGDAVGYAKKAGTGFGK
jgi:hypothetical protein